MFDIVSCRELVHLRLSKVYLRGWSRADDVVELKQQDVSVEHQCGEIVTNRVLSAGTVDKTICRDCAKSLKKRSTLSPIFHARPERRIYGRGLDTRG